jgi:aspartyl protease family protein
MKAFFIVVAVGAAIGLMLPTQSEKASPPEAGHEETLRVVSKKPERQPEETVLERSPGGHFYVDGEVNGELVRFVVDTGASVVALTVRDAERIGIPFSPGEFDVVGSGASGPVRGKPITLDTVSVDGKDVDSVRGVVVEGLDVSLLGQAYLNRLSSVEMSNGRMRLR